jgi:7-keto-8-aminopelargonate synthetase-like enzyme
VPTTDLTAVALRLRAILDPYRAHLSESTIYKMPILRRRGSKGHDWFAGVQQVEGAVKFNFLPMHNHPELLEDVSPTLRKHKTGASVFRFTEIDESLASELETLVGRGFLAYMGKAESPRRG